jgi:hypothetical protein
MRQKGHSAPSERNQLHLISDWRAHDTYEEMNDDSSGSGASYETERDLHDRTIQSLYGVMLQMENCTHLLEESSSKTRAELDVAIDKVNAIIGDVRNRIYEISAGKPGRTVAKQE